MEQFMKEKFDFKRFFLLGIKRIWSLIFAVLIGAMLFGGIYYANRVFFKGPDVYRVDAIYNIEFDTNKIGETVLYYNDYTWNDVIDSDVIGGKVASNLGMSKEIVYNATSVPTMSDIRIIHVYVDMTDPQEAQRIVLELNKAFEQFGKTTPGFYSVTNWSITDPYVLEKEFLINRVMIAGAILGLLLGILRLMYVNAMDDSVYTLKDAEHFTGVIPAGYYCSGNDEINDKLKAVISGFDGEKLLAVSLTGKSEMDTDSDICKLLKNNQNIELYSGELDDQLFSLAKNKDGVIVILKFGNHDGMRVNSLVQEMRLVGINIKTAIIDDADESFIYRYY